MIKKYDSYSIYCMHDRALNSNSTRIYCTLSLLLCIIKRHLRLRYIKPALCVFADRRESRLGVCSPGFYLGLRDGEAKEALYSS